MTCKGTLGVIAKNAKVAPRFAIRFKDSTALAEFAKAHNLADPTMLGRWRVDGLLPSVWSRGCHWYSRVARVAGIGASLFRCTAVFLRPNLVARPTPCNNTKFAQNSIQLIRFKALNAVARKWQEDESKSNRNTAAKTSSSSVGSQGRTAFLKKLAPKVTSIDLLSSSPRQRKPDDKRQAEDKTGQTPPSRKVRDASYCWKKNGKVALAQSMHA